MSKTRRIEIYDTTLRDGTQGEGFNLSLQDKLLIARRLDELGVDYIEGGFPLSNPKDEAFFKDVRELKLKHAKIAAFGMTRRRGAKAEDDPGMIALLDAQTPVVTLVGKSSEFHASIHALQQSVRSRQFFGGQRMFGCAQYSGDRFVYEGGTARAHSGSSAGLVGRHQQAQYHATDNDQANSDQGRHEIAERFAADERRRVAG